MRYMGSKTRMAKTLKSFIEPIIFEHNIEYYVEPFGGGMGSFSQISAPNKIANDINPYVIAFWNSIKDNTFTDEMWHFVSHLTEEQYADIKLDYLTNGNKYSMAIIGYVATACSYGGAWFNGYAHFNPKRNENHIYEAYNGTIKQINDFVNLSNSTFINKDYKQFNIPHKSFIYCDSPYRDTKGYINNFDNNQFFEWASTQVSLGNIVLISEYQAPNDWICIYEKTRKNFMSTNNINTRTEKLFVHKSQINLFV